MKLQFGSGSVRLRVGHGELATLQEGGVAWAALAWPCLEWKVQVRLGDGLLLQIAETIVQLTLPRTDVEVLAARLPCRDGLRYLLDLPSRPLDVRFEVDLHDGRRRPR